jgi:anthranilate phosphoribosyltransferase
LVQGAEWHAPKEGLTHHAILKKGGKNPYVSVEEAAAQLADPSIGWAYLDQSVVDPKVHAMRQMRREMVKRPFLATFEKMLQPIRAQKNYLLTQYTHKHYKLEIAKLVQNHCSFEAALHIKGIEGTSMINPTDTEAVFITPSEVKELTLNGTHWGFSQPLKKLEKASPWYVHAIGMSLINTGDHDYSEFITYQCVAILHHLLGVDPKTAVYEVQQAIASGEALSRWERLP